MFSISEELQLVENLNVSRKVDRTVYLYKGFHICHDLSFGGILTSPKDSCFVAIALTPEQILEFEAKASWTSNYCEDGFFFPEFRGDGCLEKMRVLIDKYKAEVK